MSLSKNQKIPPWRDTYSFLMAKNYICIDHYSLILSFVNPFDKLRVDPELAEGSSITKGKKLSCINVL